MLVDKGFDPDKIIEHLLTIAGLCDPVPTKMFVTSVDWAFIAKAVIAKQPAVLNEVTPQSFQVLKVGVLTVINSGSEDQEAVDEANKQAAENAHFAEKRVALISGRA